MTSKKGGEDTPTGVEMGKKEQKLKEITRMRLAEQNYPEKTFNVVLT